jgi:hypothetical protein
MYRQKPCGGRNPVNRGRSSLRRTSLPLHRAGAVVLEYRSKSPDHRASAGSTTSEVRHALGPIPAAIERDERRTLVRSVRRWDRSSGRPDWNVRCSGRSRRPELSRRPVHPGPSLVATASIQLSCIPSGGRDHRWITVASSFEPSSGCSDRTRCTRW